MMLWENRRLLLRNCHKTAYSSSLTSAYVIFWVRKQEFHFIGRSFWLTTPWFLSVKNRRWKKWRVLRETAIRREENKERKKESRVARGISAVQYRDKNAVSWWIELPERDVPAIANTTKPVRRGITLIHVDPPVVAYRPVPSLLS